MDWQPIETAPRDCRLLLTDRKYVGIGSAVGNGWFTDETRWEPDYDCYTPSTWEPTHWAHLPTPPDQQKRSPR